MPRPGKTKNNQSISKRIRRKAGSGLILRATVGNQHLRSRKSKRQRHQSKQHSRALSRSDLKVLALK